MSQHDDSVTKLLKDTTQNFSALIRDELSLMKSAMSKNLTRLAIAAGLLVCAALVILVALNVLANASVAALVGLGFQPMWAGLIVGLGLFILALIMVKICLYLFKRARRGALEAAQRIGRDAKVVKDAYDDA